jgi:signal recognition particle subunit SRP54
MPEEEQQEFMERMTSGIFTPRLLKEQYSSLMRMGSMSQMMSLLPGAASQLMPEGQDQQSQQKIKKMLTMLDSMSEKELDTSDIRVLAQPHRVERIAKGSGQTAVDAIQLLEEYKRMAGVMSKMKNLKLPKKGSATPQIQSQNAQQIAKALPQSMLQQVGGEKGLQQMLKQLEGSGSDPSQLLAQMQGGGGGGGGMNPSNLMSMLGGGGQGGK